MGSDRARVTYDERRQYRAVVAQQGRVTLEADINEAWTIADEEERKTLLEIVGPTGTPDDGYRVQAAAAPAAPFDFDVGAGTMYVGGIRTELMETLHYSKQLEWLDRLTDPDWVSPKLPASEKLARELIYLELGEQEVSATEDPTLREVALGGPDTSQRRRLVQRVKRLATDATTCIGARADAVALWQSRGLELDPKTMQLRSHGRLRAGFPPPAAPADPCDPEAGGGYLGAENQLIRVQVSAWDPAKGAGRLLWGYDDASFLYRVNVVNPTLVELQTRPPDDLHQPRAGQAVELLRTAVELEAGKDYVASATGDVFTLASPYVSDSRRVTLPGTGLPALYGNPAATPQVFMRVWEQEVKLTAGAAVQLGSTGVQVTLTTTAGAPFHVGDAWCFAVRPTTSAEVYPGRYLVAPQPPESPRTWICPLAVVSFKGGLKVVEDCRDPFDDLVELTKRRGGGCCDVIVRPEDVKGEGALQAVVDKVRGKEDVTICLMPGEYRLGSPLELFPDNEGLTIEGCHDGAVLRAADGAESNFLQGLVVINRADDVTLRNLRFRLPLVRFADAGGKLAGLSSAEATKRGLAPKTLIASIGVRPIHCATLTIEDCLFRFVVAPEETTLGVGVFAGSECWGLRLRDNRFVHDDESLRVDEPPFRFLIGYAVTPSSEIAGKQRNVGVPALLHDGTIRNNVFHGLAAAGLVFGKLGEIRLQDNSVRDGHLGFVLAATEWLAASSRLDGTDQLGFYFARDPVVAIAGTLLRAYPLPSSFAPDNAVKAETRSINALEIAVSDKLQSVFVLTKVAAQARSIGTDRPTGPQAQLQADDDGLDARTAYLRLSKSLGGVELEAAKQFAKLGFLLGLTVAGNEIRTIGTDLAGGSALTVLDAPDDGGEGTFVGNRLYVLAEEAVTAQIIGVAHNAVSGNHIGNSGHGVSLMLVPGGGSDKPEDDTSAVAGNTFVGFAVLPQRSLAAPFDTWHPFNAQT
jgi:hypothetical protein